MMPWPFYDKSLARYWLKVWGWYALIEACIQLAFNFILNNFSPRPVSNLQFHIIMWLFQCILILTIWWVAHAVYNKPIVVQVVVNLFFFIIYTLFWFGPVQDCIRFLHQYLQHLTLPAGERLPSTVDTSVKYQVLKHSFRLAFFFFANYFYCYRREEEQRLQIAIANKELQLKLLKWHLNPRFYFDTISYLKQLSYTSPAACTRPILHLAKVMEYIIYDSREKLINVSKEIQFLNHYAELINRQTHHAIKFTIITKGLYEKLKITPLLLAGFIDSIVSAANSIVNNEYFINLRFSGNTMFFKINGGAENAHESFWQANESMSKKLKELYNEKLSFYTTAENKNVKFSLRLHEE